jgi:ribosomal protein L37E
MLPAMSTTMAWGHWDCTRCGHQNISGRDKRCPACGDPREQHELDAMRPPDEADFTAAAISAPEELALASAGADWSCAYCGASNPNTATDCQGCGGARQQATSMGKVGLLGAETPAPFPDPRPVAPPRELDEAPRRKPRFTRRQIALGVLAAVVLLLWWGFRDREETGTVTRLQWTHTAELQRWLATSAGDWAPILERAEVPPRGGHGEIAGVRITGCQQKHSHDERYECGTESYQDSESYSCGSKEVCSTSNNGNGSFSRSCRQVSETCHRSVTKTRTKYCTRPIYREWCDYATQAWSTQRSAQVSGEGHSDLHNPEMPTSGDLERVQYSGTYKVSFSWDGGDELHVADVDRAAYDSWQLGDPAVLHVERLRGVVGFEKPKR